MWVRFGGDDRVKPQEYSEYFEDFTTEERSKMACRRDARTEVILSRTLRKAASASVFDGFPHRIRHECCSDAALRRCPRLLTPSSAVVVLIPFH
jgi:hypothetical protein